MSNVIDWIWTLLRENEGLLQSVAAIVAIGGAAFGVYRYFRSSKDADGKTLSIDQSASGGNVAIQTFGSINVTVGSTQQDTTVGLDFRVADLINRGIIDMERCQLDDAEKLLREAWRRREKGTRTFSVAQVRRKIGSLYFD